MVEGARLESVCRGNSTVGSNPTLSASFLTFGSFAGGSTGRQSRRTGLRPARAGANPTLSAIRFAFHSAPRSAIRRRDQARAVSTWPRRFECSRHAVFGR